MWPLIAAATASSIPFGEVGRIEADLDGDGKAELIVAGFTPKKHIVARVTGGDGRVSTLDLGPRSDIMGARVVLELSTTPRSATGVALIHIRVPAGEYCGSGNTDIYVSYTPSNKTDTLKNALELGDFYDAPIWSTVKATFDTKNLTVTIASSYGTGDTETESAVEVRAFVDGVFAAPVKR